MGRFSQALRKPFESLFNRPGREDQLAAYVIREHGLGRSMDEIMDDPYLKNRATESQRRMLLENPDVLKAIGEHTAQSATDR